ncbi:unnamed protein product [Polarella glacialis]|uniref:Coiled-coil domain-containing protein 86 n=1 Tax=Polarella glacialis TaxID=89957 RepID=A0A813HIH0_POLGL|nr:unnamed protein product [Polarella glacialis]CAE8638265.1 unnamed protein product [Polarella glacialis]|mmetsp:Transcript_65208/g.105426  ORF Transcript_65208/g.105426 Transcript_65208/m.105426 type:complete len:122 (-) Transcript_65208:52-417(-)|eukprot:CAMPEP_0115140338 /NCGR_PEP_ID=MMETSP0227-20121206/58873_1 /TAXON_ID=89957 /ORGANISM="Polarella glacialis, Strain CCMP 1383" /LENGTH=121 /DNA_ID=CAMNT_0002548471 /DNA_START=52 /DNA_END=417 /DNA_ORIENTATION=-
MVKGKAFRKTWKEARKPLNRRASSRIKSSNKASYDERVKAKRALEEVKAKSKELLEAKKESGKKKAKKKEEKKKRKEENDIKSGQYQVIKKTEKVRKWHKNARKMLVKMGPEQIERLLKKG